MEISLCQPCMGHRRPLGETVKAVLRPNVDAAHLAAEVARLEHWDRVTVHIGEVIDPYVDSRRRLVVERED